MGPESTVMDVYNSVSSITDPGVPGYLKSLVNGADAEKAYAAFLQFKDVVKNNQVSSPGPSVPTSTVMDVYNAWAGILSPSVPNKLFSGVNPLEANAAAKAFYEFKDVVKAAQR